MRRRTSVPLLVPLLACALAFATPLVSSCTTKRKTTTTTETIEYPAGSTLPDGALAEEDTTVTITRETNTTEEKEASCGGVLSCTVKFTWAVIKLPFKIVGFVLDVLI